MSALYRLLRHFLLLFLPLVAVADSAQAAPATLPDKELRDTASGLMDAVLHKQIDDVAGNLEDQTNMHRDIFKVVYSTQALAELAKTRDIVPVFDILSRARPAVHLLFQPLPAAPGHADARVRVYYYGPAQIKLKLPLSSKQRALWMVSYASCVFEKTAAGWKVPDALFDSASGGP